MSAITLSPAAAPFHGVVRVPGSKSITNRALPLAAMAEGESFLEGVLLADDTSRMLHALETLGYEIELDAAALRVRVVGLGARVPSPAEPVRIACGNSGTTIRFLTAMLALGRGTYVLDGVARMRERPIGQLVDALRVLGAEIAYEGAEGFPPVRVDGRGLRGGTCRFADAASSQFISAVLLAAPLAERDVEVRLVGPVTSEPYVAMTTRMMEQFGARVREGDAGDAGDAGDERTLHVASGARYGARRYAIEPDASNASYFLAAAAITPGASVRIPGLGRASLQGDVAFGDVLQRMGARVAFEDDAIVVVGPSELRGVDLDMSRTPDMVQTLAVVGLYARGATTARNVGNLRVKETDRLAALERELGKLGAHVACGRDWIRVEPPAKLEPASIATYDDHRMAMAFAVAGVRTPGVRIEDPECTAKTYPGYFDDLSALIRSVV